MSTSQIPARENVPVAEYVQRSFVPLSHLAHDWELHSAVFLSPAEERTMVREPVQAVPSAAADEANLARIWGGIHFRSAVRDARAAGDAIGAFVMANAAQPVHGARVGQLGK